MGRITEFDSLIVRLGGEIGIKGEWTRRTYETILLRNIKKVLKHYDTPYEKIASKRARIYVKTKNPTEVASRLIRIFGISSVSPATQIASDMNSIVQGAVTLASDLIKDKNSFAVRCHRVGKHSYSSMDICREVGKQILEHLKNRNLHVNLNNPQVTINVEARDANAYIFSETIFGAGGFPVGSQPKVACLLSGGIDSAVACWLVMKRGCPIVPVYFDNVPFTDERTTTKALDVARKLFEWSIGFSRKVYVVPHGDNLEVFVKMGSRKLTCLLCKRMMYRIAERIAESEKAEGVVTGEAIGEQASQTITNLRVLDDAAVEYPIHRPLLGFDKIETEALARKIGTFEISTRKAKGCSAAPSSPSTQAKLEAVRTVEEKFNINRMVEDSLKATKTVIV